MTASFAQLIESGYPVFAFGDPAGDIARTLAERGIAVAPVLESGRYVGMASLSRILGARRTWPPPQKVRLDHDLLDRVPSFGRDEQILDRMDALAGVQCGIVPVVGEGGLYEGVVSKRTIIGFLASIYHAGEGSVSLEIEVPPSGARVSEVVATIEKNDASVVSFGSRPAGISGMGQVLCFRVVTHDLFRLVKNLERYGYLVRHHSPFPEAGYDELREKALEFIRYIDM